MSKVTPFRNPNVRMANGKARTSSRDVSEYFGRLHKNVIRAIENLECSEKFRRLNFEPTPYMDDQGREQRGYDMSKDGFVFLAMGFTGKKAAEFKERYIAAFNAMEEHMSGRQGLPAHAMRLIEQLQEAMDGGDPRTVPMQDVTVLFRTVDERTSAIRQQLDELEAELGYLRDAVEKR